MLKFGCRLARAQGLLKFWGCLNLERLLKFGGGVTLQGGGCIAGANSTSQKDRLSLHRERANRMYSAVVFNAVVALVEIPYDEAVACGPESSSINTCLCRPVFFDNIANPDTPQPLTILMDAAVGGLILYWMMGLVPNATRPNLGNVPGWNDGARHAITEGASDPPKFFFFGSTPPPSQASGQLASVAPESILQNWPKSIF